MLVPDLRPLSVGEIIDVAIKIWRRHFSTLARVVFIVVAPLQVLAALVAASVSSSDPGFETYDGTTDIDGGDLAGWLAGIFTAQAITGLAFLIASAAVLRAVSVAYLGGTPDWRDSLRAATGRIGSIVWLGFLTFAALAASAVALFIPAIWLGVAWSVAFPVLIAENTRGTQALRRSFRLVRGRWWPTLGAVALAFLFQFFIGMIVGIPLGFLTADWDGGSAAFLVVTTIVNVASSVITTPFMAAVLVLIYFDLRVRKEGFDLQLLSQGVGIPGATLPPTGPWTGPGSYGGWAPPGSGWSPPGGSPAPPGGGWSPSGGGFPVPPTGGWQATGEGWPAPAGGWPNPAGGWSGPPQPRPTQPAPPQPGPQPVALTPPGSQPPSAPAQPPPPDTSAPTPPQWWTSGSEPTRPAADDGPPAGGWQAPIDPTGGWGPPPPPDASSSPGEGEGEPSRGAEGDEQR